jgi:hypothetical protein
MEDFTDESAAKIFEEIGDGEEPVVEQKAESVEPQGEQPLAFKTREELLKYKLGYKTSTGKDVEEDLQTILKRASAGYNYAQRMHEYNSLMDEFNTKHKPMIDEAKTWRDKYSKFEDYAKENPEWYNHWNNAYENRLTPNQGSIGQEPDYLKQVKELLGQELAPIKEFWTSKQKEEQENLVRTEYQKLTDASNQIRKQFPTMDLDVTDPETGMSKEQEVLTYMQKSGIKDFTAAFKALFHDDIVKHQVAQTKEQQLKADQERRKNGVVEVKTKRFAPKSESIGKLSWAEIQNRALNDPEIFGTK